MDTRRITCLVLSGSLLSGLLASPSAARAQDPVQATTAVNFTGSTFGVDSFDDPADCNGAAGPNHFVEFINGRLSVYDKATGNRVLTMDDETFWNQAGYVLPANWALSDPRTIYDPTIQRWFVAQITFDPSGAISTNSFLIGVSSTADPTGTWKAVEIPSDPGGSDFADFPTLGLDAQGVSIAGDMFSPTGLSVGCTLFSIPKTNLLATTPSAVGATWSGEMGYSIRGHILQPAVCLDGTAGDSVLAAYSLGYSGSTGASETNTTLVGFNVSNEAGPSSALIGGSHFITVPGYTAPLNPTQPDSSNALDDGDCRFSAAVKRVGGILYAVHATQVNNLAAVRWYRIAAANFALLESGTISDTNLNLFYPSIAANTNGTVVIACNGTSISNFISCYAAVGQTSNNVTRFGSLQLLQAGVASYHQQGSAKTSRWGDYSATSVDPADPTRFWTIQMYPSSATAWSTQITELLTSPFPPVLAISRRGADVQVTWPAADASFILESAPALTSATAWTPVSSAPSTNGNYLSVLLPVSQSQQYFRIQPPSGAGTKPLVAAGMRQL